MARTDIDDYDIDSLPLNVPGGFADAGLICDTFTVETDGLTTLAGLYINQPDSVVEIKGTVILIHNEADDRTAMLPLSMILIDSGYNVIIYDQRAAGFSTGKYHGEGRYEADDLIEMIAFFNLRDRLTHPVSVVGYGLGAEAAILAGIDEARIDRVAAFYPYLSTGGLIEAKVKQREMLWFPFRTTILWWWYNIRSSYAAPYREVEQIKGTNKPTLLVLDPDQVSGTAASLFKERSDSNRLEIVESNGPDQNLTEKLFSFLSEK
jgi:pimeloyl-ACP methyl ester carboxylesterase